MTARTTPAEKAFETASARLLGAGCTLATIAENAAKSDPVLARTLQIHADAKAQYEAAFDALMGTADPVPADLADKSIAAMRAELAETKGGQS